MGVNILYEKKVALGRVARVSGCTKKKEMAYP